MLFDDHIKNLILKVRTETLAELIERISLLQNDPGSLDLRYWIGERETSNVSDPSEMDKLVEFLRTEPNKERRSNAYFNIGKLGVKYRSAECALILISRLDSEENKYVLSTILDALADLHKRRDLDLSPILRRLRDDRWLVRHAAIIETRAIE